MTKVRKAVIPAAGLGTRFLPATKAQPKEMLPLLDKPAIQYVVEEAVRATNASQPGDLGKVMGALMKAHKGEVDGTLARTIAARILGH